MGLNLGKSGENAFAGKGATEFKNDSPMSLKYKGKEFMVGDTWVFRVLSLDSKFTRNITARKVKILNPRTGDYMDIMVADQGPRNKELHDHAGRSLDTCDVTSIFRMPVWVYGKINASGKKEKIAKLMFLEFTSGLVASLNALEEKQGGKCAFDEKSGRPEYDIQLKILYNNKEFPKTYEFEPVIMDDEMERHPNFKVVTEKVLEDEYEQIEAGWAELQKEMDFGLDFEFVQKAIAPRKSKGGDAEDTKPNKSISRTPKVAESDDEEEKPKKKKPAEAEVDEEETPPPAKKKTKFDFDDE